MIKLLFLNASGKDRLSDIMQSSVCCRVVVSITAEEFSCIYDRILLLFRFQSNDQIMLNHSSSKALPIS